ncbi:MAG: hypothetical protein P4L96_22145 [Rhodoferax sp.]|nr:hypothetical protein [Rhodoferax sp.]
MDALPYCARPAFRLCFEPLVLNERAIDIPCDAAGRVDLGRLDEDSRNAYLYTRIVGRFRFAAPVVRVV